MNQTENGEKNKKNADENKRKVLVADLSCKPSLKTKIG